MEKSINKYRVCISIFLVVCGWLYALLMIIRSGIYAQRITKELSLPVYNQNEFAKQNCFASNNKYLLSYLSLNKSCNLIGEHD